MATEAAVTDFGEHGYARRPDQRARAAHALRRRTGPDGDPQIVCRFTGLAADSPDFQAAYAEQPGEVIDRLAD